MKEDEFYEILDLIESMEGKDLTNSYFPTIAELESHNVMKDIETFLPMITYFANDPFTRMGMSESTLIEYKATVKYCKDLLTKINLES